MPQFLQQKYAVIDTAASPDTTLVAAVTAKRIRVTSMFLVTSGGANTIRFESGTGGTALTGQVGMATTSVLVLPYNEHGWFETAAGALLNLELSAATSVDGSLSYIEA
jgi:hypothetical protein